MRLRWFFVMLMIFCAPAEAAPSLKDAIRAELVSDVTAVSPGEGFTVAVKLTMDPEWHTYWKNPGDGGMATTVEWKLPSGITAGELEWPAPIRFETSDIVNYGYAGEVLLLTRFTASKIEAPVTIRAKVNWLGCKNICVPGGAELEIALKAGAAEPSKGAAAVAAARASVPRPLAGWKLDAWRDGTTLFLELEPESAPAVKLTAPYFFAADELAIEYAAPQHLENVKGHYAMRLELSSSASSTLKSLRGVLTGPEGWSGVPGKAFTIDVPVKPAKQ